jgi:hypothetical protein
MFFVSIIACGLVALNTAAQTVPSNSTTIGVGVNASSIQVPTVNASAYLGISANLSTITNNSPRSNAFARAITVVSRTVGIGQPLNSTTSAASAPTEVTGVNAYNFISARSGTRLHLLPLYAKNNAIRIGGQLPSSQTPNIPALAGLPSTTTTTFLIGGGAAALDVSVPGGQQVYVASDGRLSYTVPHSAHTGIGSIVSGFSVSPVGPLVQLNFNGVSGFIACPAISRGASPDEYDIYVVERTTRTGCTGINILGSANSDPPQAWQW